VHPLAYAADPSYATYKLSSTEKRDCKEALKKLLPNEWTSAKAQLDDLRGSPEKFTEQEWAKADTMHAWKWWRSFGEDFEVLQPLAMKILSKPAAASACEFNWSDCSLVLTTKITQ
jgi:hypothetical protein